MYCVSQKTTVRIALVWQFTSTNRILNLVTYLRMSQKYFCSFEGLPITRIVTYRNSYWNDNHDGRYASNLSGDWASNQLLSSIPIYTPFTTFFVLKNSSFKKCPFVTNGQWKEKKTMSHFHPSLWGEWSLKFTSDCSFMIAHQDSLIAANLTKVWEWFLWRERKNNWFYNAKLQGIKQFKSPLSIVTTSENRRRVICLLMVSSFEDFQAVKKETTCIFVNSSHRIFCTHNGSQPVKRTR